MALAFVPLEIDPAEARGIKLRMRSGGGHAKGAADNAEQPPQRGVRIRIRNHGGSRTDSDAAEKADHPLKARTRSPGAVEAAAERARAALEAEKALVAKAANAANAQPVVGGKTTAYPSGVMCVAGC